MLIIITNIRYGCTKILISDQGREFVNEVNKTLCRKFKTDHRISTAYHPQTNGLVERYNQTLQRSLVKLVNKEQNDWDKFIDGVLFAYRTSKQKSTDVTPFELMYCRYVLIWALLYRGAGTGPADPAAAGPILKKKKSVTKDYSNLIML